MTFIQNQIDAYDNVQDGITETLSGYSVYDALQNSAEAWSMVSSQTIANCWRKTGILPLDDDNDDDDDEDLVSDDEMILDEYVFKFLFNYFVCHDFELQINQFMINLDSLRICRIIGL